MAFEKFNTGRAKTLGAEGSSYFSLCSSMMVVPQQPLSQRLACHHLYELSNEIHPAGARQAVWPSAKQVICLPPFRDSTQPTPSFSYNLLSANYVQSAVKPEDTKKNRLPWWYDGKESACQCKGNGV